MQRVGENRQKPVWTSSRRLGLVVLLVHDVEYLLADCLGRITKEEREIVDYTNSGDGTSANTVRARTASTEI